MLTIHDVVTGAELQWRSMGITRRDREAMAQDLRRELETVAADGADIHDIISGDIPTFARDIAVAADANHVPYNTKPVLLAALLGACPGLAGYILVWLWPTVRGIHTQWPPTPFTDAHGHTTFMIVAYIILPLIAIVGALTGVWTRHKRHATIGRTVAAMVLLLPLAWLCTAAIFNIITMPSLFSTVTVGTGLFAFATTIAHRWAVASTRRTLGAAPAIRHLPTKIS
jgi:hypothetical protein